MISPTLIADRYQLLEEIGRGAMGIIYRGVDNETAVPVAIKMLNEQVVATDPDLLRRFQQEGKLLRQLNHPNIVKMLAAAEQNGRYFLIMEYMPGGDLRQHLRAVGALSLDEALTIALDLADALVRTHRLNILHRDLKPANVLLDAQGLPRLTDFGVARPDQTADLTHQGAIMGTIAYLSPEACLGEPLDERTDIWSFGILLYEMLLGKRPFEAPTMAGILHGIINDPLPLPSSLRLDIPEQLDELIQRMLVKHREHRIPSMRQVGAELEAILKGYQQTPVNLYAPLAGRKEEAAPSFFDTPTPKTAVINHNLPRPTNPFIGRQRELLELTRLLTDRALPLITIVGSGGMGKTRLAVEIGRYFIDPFAEQPTQKIITPTAELEDSLTQEEVGFSQPFPDGVYFVPLASLGEPGMITTLLADVFGYRFHDHDDHQQQILTLLRRKKLLLILDNFEHLLASANQSASEAKALVLAMLQAAPGVKLCITSRQRLELHSETSFPISGLDVPEDLQTAHQTSAAQLFVQSAKRVQFDFQLQPEALPHVAQICRLVQGMPLGIVLAAAWVDVLPLAEIAAEIQRDAGFLAAESADLPLRQQSMRATFAYSWQLLDAEERMVFSRLAVFREGFTRQAAKVVAETTLRPLARLASRSLLHYDPVQDRYAIHELLRRFAEEKLVENSELILIQQVHCRYYLQMLAASEAELKGGDQRGGIERITADLENIRTAWRFGVQTAVWPDLNQALEGLHLFYYLNAQASVGLAEFRQTLTQTPADGPSLHFRLRLLNRLYMLAPNDSQFEPTEIETLLAYFAAKGDRLEEALGLDNQAKYLSLKEQFEPALALRQRCVVQLAQLGESFYRSRCYINIAAHTVNQLGQLDVFVEAGERSYALTRQARDFLGMRIALHMKAGHALFFQGDYQLAVSQYQEAIEAAHQVGGLHLVAQSLPSLSFAHFLLGAFEAANELAQTALGIFGQRNDSQHLALSRRSHGFLALVAGDIEIAQQEFGEALKLTKEVAVVGTAIGGLALAAWVQEDRAQALNYLQFLWAGVLRSKSFVMLLWYVPLVADLLADGQKPLRAVEMLALADAHPACPAGWWRRWPRAQQVRDRLQAVLPEADYLAAQGRGRALALEETAVSLLEELQELASHLS